MEPKERIIVALDVPSIEVAKPAVGELAPYVGCFKIGLGAISYGFAHELARIIINSGGKVGWDGKFDDIPNTVGAATKEVATLGVEWANVHASAGLKSVVAAVENRGGTKIYGVTVLTTIDPKEC